MEAVAWIQSLAWELPYASGVAIKKKKKKKKSQVKSDTDDVRSRKWPGPGGPGEP